MHMCLAIQPTELEPPPPYNSVCGSVNDADSGENPGIDTPAAPVLSSEPQQQNVRYYHVASIPDTLQVSYHILLLNY